MCSRSFISFGLTRGGHIPQLVTYISIHRNCLLKSLTYNITVTFHNHKLGVLRSSSASCEFPTESANSTEGPTISYLRRGRLSFERRSSERACEKVREKTVDILEGAERPDSIYYRNAQSAGITACIKAGHPGQTSYNRLAASAHREREHARRRRRLPGQEGRYPPKTVEFKQGPDRSVRSGRGGYQEQK